MLDVSRSFPQTVRCDHFMDYPHSQCGFQSPWSPGIYWPLPLFLLYSPLTFWLLGSHLLVLYVSMAMALKLRQVGLLGLSGVLFVSAGVLSIAGVDNLLNFNNFGHDCPSIQNEFDLLRCSQNQRRGKLIYWSHSSIHTVSQNIKCPEVELKMDYGLDTWYYSDLNVYLTLASAVNG